MLISGDLTGYTNAGLDDILSELRGAIGEVEAEQERSEDESRTPEERAARAKSAKETQEWMDKIMPRVKNLRKLFEVPSGTDIVFVGHQEDWDYWDGSLCTATLID